MVHPVNAFTRSFEFLIEQLTESQVLSLRALGCIPVKASDGSRWLVLPAAAQQAYSMDEDKVYCLSPVDKRIPFGDATLAVVLMLQDDVEDFLSKANHARDVEKIRHHHAYTTSFYSIFNGIQLAGDLQEYLNVSDEHWRDLFACNNDTCNNNDDIPNYCDFHKGTHVVAHLVYEIHKWQDTFDLQQMLAEGLSSIAAYRNYQRSPDPENHPMTEVIQAAVVNVMFDLKNNPRRLQRLIKAIETEDSSVPPEIELGIISMLINRHGAPDDA